MGKRFWICATVVFFAAMLLSFLVHGLLLAPDYQALGAMYRDADDGRRHLPWIMVAHASLGLAMTWLFANGASPERPSLAQGLRFGVAVALLASVPGILIHYAVQPLPGLLVLKQVVFGVAGMGLLGMLLAWLQPRRIELEPLD